MNNTSDEDDDLQQLEKKADDNLKRGISVVAASLVIYWVSVYLILDQWDERGTFGDMFGGINAFFTGLAFVGLVYTIFQQKIQLEMQRKELRLQRKEVAKTREELVQQNKTMRLQRFENTFFQLLSLERSTAEILKAGTVLSDILRETRSRRHAKESFDIEWIKSIYKDKILSTYLGVYFKTLYRVISFVDEVEFLNSYERNFYISLVEAQLSPSQIQLLLLHVIAENKEYLNFGCLVRKYNILDTIDTRKEEIRVCYRTYEETYKK